MFVVGRGAADTTIFPRWRATQPFEFFFFFFLTIFRVKRGHLVTTNFVQWQDQAADAKEHYHICKQAVEM